MLDANITATYASDPMPQIRYGGRKSSDERKVPATET
jgi:hypothetical protein